MNPTLNNRISLATFFAWSPYLLLGLGLLLTGMKTPVAFLPWALLALGLCWKESRSSSLYRARGPIRLELGLLGCVVGAFVASMDRSASLYSTAQIILFLLFWILFSRSSSANLQVDGLGACTFVLAFLSLIVTFWQFKGIFVDVLHFMRFDWAKTYGLLPLNPTYNAVFMCSAAMLLLFLNFESRWPRWVTVGHRILGTALIVMVFLSPSRTAFVGLGLSLLYLFWPSINARRMIGALLLVLILAVLIPKGFLEERLRVTKEVNYRSKLQTVAFLAVRDRPLTGYGPGNFGMAYERHSFPVETDKVRFGRTTTFAHNEYAQLASDVGLPACIFFLLIVLRVLTLKIPIAMRPVKAALIILCVSAMNTHVWHVPFLAFWTLLLGLCLVHSARAGRGENKPRIPIDVLKRTVSAVIIFLAISLGWSGLRDGWAQNNQWDRITRANPWDAQAWQQLGYATPTPSQAVVIFKKAASLVPANTYFQESYAHALWATGDLDLAIAHLQFALQWAPHRAINTLSIAKILFHKGDYRAALAWCQAARRLEPHYWECDYWIAQCLRKMGHPDRAKWVLRNLQRRHANYLLETERMKVYLPYARKIDSDYSNLLMAYDENAIQKELR